MPLLLNFAAKEMTDAIDHCSAQARRLQTSDDLAVLDARSSYFCIEETLQGAMRVRDKADRLAAELRQLHEVLKIKANHPISLETLDKDCGVPAVEVAGCLWASQDRLCLLHQGISLRRELTRLKKSGASGG
jgi:hypothetical protein